MVGINQARQSARNDTSPRAPAAEALSAGPASHAFAQLLKIESDARRSASVSEVHALLANDGRRLTRARQIFVLELAHGRATLRAATGIAILDRTTPMVRWIEGVTQRVTAERGTAEAVELWLPDIADPADPLTREYPFRNVLWQPLWSARGSPQATALLLRETPWTEADRAISARLGESIGHARAFLLLGADKRRYLRFRPAAVVAGAFATLVAFAAPVPMSVLAPLEISPRNAEVVAMPQDGIVREILVQPSSKVSEGAALVRLVDTVQRSRLELAEREVAVVEARVEKAMSLAFSDPRGRQELGVARAELALKRAEAKYARELLAQTVIEARTSGIAIFSDPRELEGKPLSTGERLMLIGRESETEIKISLPVADSIVLRPGLKVRAFLDSAPLNAIEGVLAHFDYQVRIDDQQIASYRLTAHAGEAEAPLKLGSRGTAQIIGDPVPLIVFLLRRPLTAFRQWMGI